jgi:putative ABC transport system permease protein
MFLQDLRHAFRSLSVARGFTLASVLSLALGIGANVAIFSLVNVVLLKPLAYRDPERLVLIREVMPKFSHLWPHLPVKSVYVLLWRKELHSFESIGTALGRSMNLSGGGQPEKIGTVMMTAEFLDMLGAKPQLGRWFLRAEEDRGAPDVVILSNSLWHRRFSADPNIVGRKILLDGKPHEVVGVTPSGMPFYRQHLEANLPERADLFLPLRLPPDELDLTIVESGFWGAAVGRLKRGVTLEQAHAEVEVSMAALSRGNKEHIEIHAQMQPLQRALTGDTSKGLLVLLGAVRFVLLIVCVNLANLTLVRATKNRRELAVRAALGAGRRHLIGPSLAESVLIAAGGTTLGLLLAVWIKGLVVMRAPAQLPRLEEAALDGNVLAFAIGLCTVTVILFGLLPAWHMSRVSLVESLQSGSRGNTDGPRGGRLRAVLVSAEVALSLLLLIGAALLLASFQRVMNVSRGFQVENIMAVNLALPDTKYRAAEGNISFFRRVLEGVSSLPGVRNTGYTTALPLDPPLETAAAVKPGTDNLPLDARPMTSYLHVSSDYFPAAGIPLHAGRLFKPGEKELVAVVSESAARRVWPGENPIGQTVRHWVDPTKNHWFTVIGVVGDVRSDGLVQAPDPPIYLPYWQMGWQNGGDGELVLVVRTAIQPDTIIGAIREQVWNIDRDVPVPELRTMTRMVSDFAAPRRFQTVMVAAFALIALLLASIGIYGVVAYTVTQRRAEIGVRLALGANQRDIKSLTLRQSMKPVAVGLGVGLIAATILGRLIASLLFEVRAVDPLTFAAAPILLSLVAALACYIPARQAARIDPMMALRYE